MENSCRECRKFSEKLFLKGDRCLGVKCTLTRRQNAPGTSGGGKVIAKRGRKKSEYGIQLAEKQKAKKEYGLRERQFRLVYAKAAKSKYATGELILQILERRLDNVVYRLGWAASRRQARQMVSHGHFKVNSEIVDIPSYLIKEKDVIEPQNAQILENKSKIKPPSWLKADTKSAKAEVVALPSREMIDTPVDEQLIVEYYSR